MMKSPKAANLKGLAEKAEQEADRLLLQERIHEEPLSLLREYRALVMLAQWARQRSLALEGQEITK